MADQTPESAPAPEAAAATDTPAPAETAAPAGDVGSPPSDASPAPEPAPEPSPADSDWRTALPDDLRQAKALSDVADVESLAKQFVDQQSFLGNSVRIPSEHASEADVEAFRSKLREVLPNLREVDPAQLAPESATDYKAPELDIQLDPGMANNYAEWAHHAGLSQDQYDTLLRHYVDNEVQMAQQLDEAKKVEYGALREEWGPAYDEKVNMALRVATLSDAPEELQQAIAKQEIRPDLMRWLSGLAEQLGDEGKVAEMHSGRVEMTPNEAQAQIDEIMSNREHPYWSAAAGTPEKQRAIEELMTLRGKAMGKEGRRPHVVLGGFDEDQEVQGGTLFAGSVR